MFLTEFFTLLIIIMVCFAGYKYRKQILKWLNDRPSVSTKRYVIKDLDTLQKYGVTDALDRIVTSEETWERDVTTLQKRLADMKDRVHKEINGDPTETKKDTAKT